MYNNEGLMAEIVDVYSLHAGRSLLYHGMKYISVLHYTSLETIIISR